jgi:ERCC4-type nuclease
MQFFWKIVLAIILSLGAYRYFKKSTHRSENEEGLEPKNEDNTTSQPSSVSDKQGKIKGTDERVIERLAKIDGVTRRVAENLAKKGITTKEDLTKLSEEELRSVKGIGPKRAAKILTLK